MRHKMLSEIHVAADKREASCWCLWVTLDVFLAQPHGVNSVDRKIFPEKTGLGSLSKLAVSLAQTRDGFPCEAGWAEGSNPCWQLCVTTAVLPRVGGFRWVRVRIKSHTPEEVGYFWLCWHDPLFLPRENYFLPFLQGSSPFLWPQSQYLQPGNLFPQIAWSTVFLDSGHIPLQPSTPKASFSVVFGFMNQDFWHWHMHSTQ